MGVVLFYSLRTLVRCLIRVVIVSLYEKLLLMKGRCFTISIKIEKKKVLIKTVNQRVLYSEFNFYRLFSKFWEKMKGIYIV